MVNLSERLRQESGALHLPKEAGVMRILLIEDTRSMATAFKSLLESDGHEVTWILGVAQLEPFVAISESGKEQLLELTDFEVAYCDGQIEGPFEGSDAVRLLRQAGVSCVGISTVSEFNDRMLSSGALVAINKAAAMVALFAGQLQPRQVRQEPELVRSTNYQKLVQNRALRKKADAFVLPFITEKA